MLKQVTSAFGYEQIADLSSAKNLTVPKKDLTGRASVPVFAMILSEGQAVRWRDDGVAPTATVGMPLAAGTVLEYDGDLTRLQFIEQTSGAKLNISYYS